MLGNLFKQKDANKQIARDLHAVAVENTRQEFFYTKMHVPDSFDGRFDLLILHIFLLMQRFGNKDLSQALFDETFFNMKETLRQRGIGDVGIPKHMKRMMLAFNGRIHAYDSALLSEITMKQAISRNIYDNKVDKDTLDLIYMFVRNNLDSNNRDIDKLMSSNAKFIND